MAQFKKLSLAVAAVTLLGANAAHAVDLQAGDWKLSVGGNVNAFAIANTCDKSGNAAINGAVVCQGQDSFNIGNGLLPNEISFSASTRQDDLDINAVISLWPTINTTAAGETGTGSGTTGTGLNSRQGFFTFGDKSWGTVKLGRDLGIFGSDAILSDMTLLSVGSGTPAKGPTSLGHIGTGYLYADWIPQISYATPSFNGLAANVGIVQGLASTSGVSNKQPGFQGKVTYDTAVSGVNAHLWAGFMTQKNEASGTVQAFDSTAYEVGAKLGIGDFEGVGYYYDGDGAGTTVIGNLASDTNGNKRKSKGGYVQGTYKIQKVKLGLSYGESSLDLASGEVNNDLIKKNSSGVASIYYSLTKSITLVGEYVNTKSERQAGGGDLKQDTVAVGGIIFF